MGSVGARGKDQPCQRQVRAAFFDEAVGKGRAGVGAAVGDSEEASFDIEQRNRFLVHDNG
jgi:hypothetical protein